MAFDRAGSTRRSATIGARVNRPCRRRLLPPTIRGTKICFGRDRRVWRVPAPDPAGKIKVEGAGAAQDEPPRGPGMKDRETTGRFDEPVRDGAEALAPGLFQHIGAGLQALVIAAFFLIPRFASRASSNGGPIHVISQTRHGTSMQPADRRPARGDVSSLGSCRRNGPRELRRRCSALQLSGQVARVWSQDEIDGSFAIGEE